MGAAPTSNLYEKGIVHKGFYNMLHEVPEGDQLKSPVDVSLSASQLGAVLCGMLAIACMGLAPSCRSQTAALPLLLMPAAKAFLCTTNRVLRTDTHLPCKHACNAITAGRELLFIKACEVRCCCSIAGY